MSNEAHPVNKVRDLVLAMVALSKPALPHLAELEKRLKECPATSHLTDFKRDGDVISFSNKASGFGAIALIPVPLPWHDLEGPSATSWLWPEAAQELIKHTHHLIVTVSGGKSDIIGASLQLTTVVAALCSQPECIGVYWGAGRLVLSPRVFLAFSKEMSREFLPLYLWIDFRRQQNADGTFTVYTTGMEALGFMEIEIQNSHKKFDELIDRAFNISHYLLDNGPVLKDGDTIGLTAEEKIKIRHTPSMWDKNSLVYQLTL